MNATIKPFTLANIYGPNDDNPSFLNFFFAALHEKTNIILGGDFNTVINPTLDCSNSSANTRHTHSSEIIKHYQEYGNSNGWRMKNPTQLEYSYTSPHHQTSPRLHFFLISNSLTQYITESSIHPVIISDHAPVSVTISNQTNTNKQHLRGHRFQHSYTERVGILSGDERLSRYLAITSMGNR